MLEQRLADLAIEEQTSAPVSVKGAAKHMRTAFGELLSTSPSSLVLATEHAEPEAEAKMWDCFAEVYEQEVAAQQQDAPSSLSTEQKRQILADILVWAEVTQEHYDAHTTQFVIDPHGKDASFQRIGKLLKEAKARRGF